MSHFMGAWANFVFHACEMKSITSLAGMNANQCLCGGDDADAAIVADHEQIVVTGDEAPPPRPLSEGCMKRW